MGVLKPRTTTVTLYHGDDLERLAELHQEARVATARADAAARKVEAIGESDAAPLRGGDTDEGSVAAREHREALAEKEAAEAAYDDFVTGAAERAVEVRLQAIGSTRFSDLLLAHPARSTLDEDGKPQVHEDDLAFSRVQEMAGYRPVLVDVSTFPRALAGFRDETKRTIVEPDTSEEELAEFLDDECSEGDLERLWTAAFFLNRGGADPKGTRFSTSSRS